jgi:hypothetical protein
MRTTANTRGKQRGKSERPVASGSVRSRFHPRKMFNIKNGNHLESTQVFTHPLPLAKATAVI